MKEAHVRITGDASDLIKETDKAKESLKGVEKQADKTSKSVDDVASNGGAIAVLDSLTGGLATRFKDAYEASKLFSFSLKGVKTALIATGVGAFVVALGLVVAYWDDIVELITQANRRLQQNIDLHIDLLDTYDKQLKILDAEEKLLTAQGKSTESIKQKRIDILKLQQASNAQLILDLQTQLLKVSQVEAEAKWWEKILYFRSRILQARAQDDAEQEKKKNEKAINDQILAQKERELQLELLLLQTQNPEVKSGTKTESGTALPKAEGVGGENLDFGRVEARKTINDLLIEEEQRLSGIEIDIANLTADEILAIEERLKNAKIAVAQQTLGNLGALAKEGSGLAKGIAASQATINTFQGVTAALSATSVIPDPFGTILKFVNAAAIGVAGFINVKKILATKPVTTGAPSASGGGAPPAPSFNVVQGTESNQIANSVNKGSAPVKAFVVTSDVSSGQSMDRNIIEGATL